MNTLIATMLGVIGPELDASVVLLLVVIGVIISILPIILFFKVWGMCNNVKEIKRLLKDYLYDKD